MKIGQLAAATGTPVETIRYYEREGLLPEAGRTDANYRVYGPAHVDRLAFIRHCRCLDMTLEEIRALLRVKDEPQADCAAADALLDAHIQHVTERIQQLRVLEKELRALRASCAHAGTAGECGVLGGLQKAAREHDHAPRRGGTHGTARGH
jgi:Cd(II)/Pb(II)-responsive transcriptional regulator